MKALLDFVAFPRRPGQLTSVWAVALRGVGMGFVVWNSPAREYVFRAAVVGIIFAPVAIREIADFCERETNARRKARKAPETAA